MNFVFNPKKHTIFEPINKEKYKGDVFPTARSKWESTFYKWCDLNNSITAWVVEGISIDYFDSVKQKNRKYYPDVMMSVRDKNGKDNIFLSSFVNFARI